MHDENEPLYNHNKIKINNKKNRVKYARKSRRELKRELKNKLNGFFDEEE